MSKELFEKRNKLTYDLRQALDKWEADNNRPTHEFDVRANGLLKEQVQRLEKDLDQVESALNASLASEKLAKREAELATPEFDVRKSNFIQPKDEYTTRFAKALFSGNKVAMDRVMNERAHGGVFTSDTQVNSAIPQEWQNRIVEKINQLNVMRQICPIRNVGADQKIVVGGALPTAYLMTEGTAITVDDSLAYSVETVGDSTYGCYIPVSKQFANDAVGGLEYIARKAGEAIANKLETAYLSGPGTGGDVAGLLSNTFTTTPVDSGGTTLTITADNIISMAHAVDPQYRKNGSYLFSDSLLQVIRKIKVTSSGNDYIWKMPERYSDIRDGMPATLYGYPVYMSPAVSTATTAGGTVGLFGDFNFYEIYDRDGGANVFIDPYGLSTALVNRVVVSHRTGGVCTNKAAFVRYTI